MDKVWFIFVDNKKEGPFTPLELKEDPRVNPDLLVWKEGFHAWIAIRHVPELALVFKDTHIQSPKQVDPGEQTSSDLIPEQATLTLRQDPLQWILWVLILILILILVYTYHEMFS